MTPWVIETKGLGKIFGPARRSVLKDIHLNIRQGEIFALLGVNGAGKTTLIKILSSLILPDEGEVRVFGENILRYPHRIKPLISLVVGEERSFYWRLTGRQNLEFFAALYNLPRKEARRRIEKAAVLLGIENLDNRYQEYSTGMKHRLALVRSLLSEARLILMDEPTRSLDPNAAFKLREIIRNDFSGGTQRTVFFTTHQLQEAEALADRIAILDKGKIKVCGTMKELQDNCSRPGASLEKIFQHYTSEVD
ncbi:MAG: ABC transporter ATP-binding protein [Deltaproteobacteria bacterium]|nr:ABC transporter ATP-binding protein [Deltaproteobacteria bacterium]